MNDEVDPEIVNQEFIDFKEAWVKVQATHEDYVQTVVTLEEPVADDEWIQELEEIYQEMVIRKMRY